MPSLARVKLSGDGRPAGFVLMLPIPGRITELLKRVSGTGLEGKKHIVHSGALI